MRKVANFRDFGGYKAGSSRIKKGLLYRSGHLDRVKKDDLEEISSLGIKTIIDLRSPWDIKRKRAFLPGVNTIHLPVNFDKTVYDRVKPILFSSGARKKISDIYISSYAGLVTGEKALIRRILTLLSSPENYPFVIHCRAGKDRTGFVCSIIQMALGVENGTIIDDYLLSNRYYLPHFRKKLRYAKICTLGLLPTGNIEHLASVDLQYIQAIFGTIKQNFGGIDYYLEQCGVDKQALEHIKEITLE